MEMMYILLGLSLLLAGFFLYGFIRSIDSGEWDDLETPPYEILLDDDQRDKKDKHES